MSKTKQNTVRLHRDENQPPSTNKSTKMKASDHKSNTGSNTRTLPTRDMTNKAALDKGGSLSYIALFSQPLSCSSI
jgi:hypothetical protein